MGTLDYRPARLSRRPRCPAPTSHSARSSGPEFATPGRALWRAPPCCSALSLSSPTRTIVFVRVSVLKEVLMMVDVVARSQRRKSEWKGGGARGRRLWGREAKRSPSGHPLLSPFTPAFLPFSPHHHQKQPCPSCPYSSCPPRPLPWWARRPRPAARRRRPRPRRRGRPGGSELRREREETGRREVSLRGGEGQGPCPLGRPATPATPQEGVGGWPCLAVRGSAGRGGRWAAHGPREARAREWREGRRET